MVKEALSKVISDGLTMFGLTMSPGSTPVQLSGALISAINDHLTSPPEAIEVTTTTRRWTPLGFAIAEEIAVRTEPASSSNPSTNPADLTNPE